MTDKEPIMIDGVDVSGCKYLPYCNDKQGNCAFEPNCYYKQLQKEKFENLNNRQMVESAENLIYENSELYKNLKEKEQECEQIQAKYEALKLENEEGYEIVAELKQECEELKKQLMQKDEVNTFFNAPIEGWSSNPCDVCESKNNYENLSEKYEALKLENQEGYEIVAELKQECEELKK